MNDVTQTDVLPNRPSELLDLALDDLEKVEQDPNYVVDMAYWHAPKGSKCFVCLAGSVVAQTLRLDSRTHAWFNVVDFSRMFPNAVCRKLIALNLLRTGSIWSGLDLLGLRTLRLPPNCWITPYSQDVDLFKRDLRQLAHDLRFEHL